MYALDQTAVEFFRIQVQASPKTTYSIVVISGGTSVNLISLSASMELDMRSESPPDLNRVEERMLKIINEAAESENFARSVKEEKITVEAKLIGDRPAGSTNETTDMTRYAKAAAEASGYKPKFGRSSADANLPMSVGILALTVLATAPGKSGCSHPLDGWIDVQKEPMVKAMATTLTIVLAVAGLE